MKMADMLAQATANGWEDDSRWTRSTIAEQVSRTRDGLLAIVSVLTDGTVRWHVFNPDHLRGQRGTAATPEAAFNSVDLATSAITGTLF